MALRSKKSSLTEKSMRLRDAIKFCSYQDAKGCSSSYSAHRDWSIPQASRKLKSLFSQIILHCHLLNPKQTLAYMLQSCHRYLVGFLQSFLHLVLESLLLITQY